MKLLIVANEFPPGPGGLGTHAFEIASQLSKSQTVFVICAQHDKDRKEVMEFNSKLPFSISTNPRGSFLIVLVIRKIILICKALYRIKPDIVMPSGSNSIWICSFLKIWFRFKQVTIVHGGELTFRTWWRRKFTLMGCDYSDRMISVSNYTAKFLYQYGIQKERVRVIPNGANEKIFRFNPEKEKLRKLYGFEGKRVILTVGSVSERKGQDIVIQALTEVVRLIPEIVYVIVGKSNKQEYFESIARKHGVLSQVVFFGIASNQQLVDLYNLADLFILNSRHSRDGDFEGFGIAVIEAALCGLPAIVSKESGLTEAIEEGITGLSIRPEDPVETSKAIALLLRDNVLRERMANASLERARRDYTWDKIGEKYRIELKEVFQ